jgi:hypothetical protein
MRLVVGAAPPPCVRHPRSGSRLALGRCRFWGFLSRRRFISLDSDTLRFRQARFQPALFPDRTFQPQVSSRSHLTAGSDVARGRVKGIITVDDDLGQTTGPTPVRACPEIPEKAELLGAATCTALAKSFRGAACCVRTQHYVIVDMGTPTLVASSKFKSNESTGNAGPESMIYAVRKLHITMVLLCFVAAATPARALQCAAQAQLCRIQCDDQWLASQTCVGMSDTQKSSCYYNASTNLRDCRHYCVTNYCSAGQAPHQGGHGWAQARPRGQ